MASEFTIDIQLTELGFHHLPVFDEELPIKETSQINSSSSPPNVPGPSKSPPPVTNSPVDQRLLGLVQDNVHTLPKSLPVTVRAVNSPSSQSTHDMVENIHPQSPHHLAVIEKDICPEKAASSDLNPKTKPVVTTKQTQAVGEKNDDGKTVTTENRSFVGRRRREEQSNPEKKASAQKGALQIDEAISQSDSNGSQENPALEESDDSEVSEQEEEEDEEEEDEDDDNLLFAPDAAGEHHCSVCHQAFINGFLLREHMHQHTGVRPYRCAECDKQFCHLANYRAHLRTHAQAVPIRCRVCQASFESEERLDLHLKTTHFETEFYQCDYCKRIFTCLTECRMHVQKHKNEASKPHCPQCNQRFTTAKSLRRHMQKHSCQRSFLCSDCGQCFRKKNLLLRHSFSHLGLLPYTCTHCKTHFRLASLYHKHQCKPETIQCVACLSTFTSRGDFEEHKKATGCWGYQGGQGTQLLRHTTRSQQDEIRCMECGQTFVTAEELKKHAGSHQRVLKCAECGMGFRSSLMLMSHMGGHAGQRPCLCQQCGLGFPHQQGYDLHLKDCGVTLPPKVAMKKTKPVQNKTVKPQHAVVPQTTAPTLPQNKAQEVSITNRAQTPTSPQNKAQEVSITNRAQTPTLPQNKAPEVSTTNRTQAHPPGPTVPDQPAEGVWKLSLDKAPPPNTPLVVLLPFNATIPSNLSVSTAEPQTQVLTEENNGAPLVKPRLIQESDANRVPDPVLYAAVADNTESPQPFEQQQLNTLSQPGLTTPVIKIEPADPSYSEKCMLSSFGNMCDVPDIVQVKKEESGQEKNEFRFCEAKLSTAPLKTETKEELKEELKSSDLETQIHAEDLSLPNVIKESGEHLERSNPLISGVRSGSSVTLEQSDILITDVKTDIGEHLEQSNLLISDVRSESNIVSEGVKKTVEQTQQRETETCSQVPGHLEIPLDLRLNVKHSDKCPEALSQENTVSGVVGETDARDHHHHESEANKKVAEDSYSATVEVDLRDEQRNELGELEGEPHECVTCGWIILDGDLVQHYMEHAMQADHDVTKQPSSSRPPSVSSSSSSFSPSSSGFTSPNITPPASPPSKRLRSRAK
ncbi:protein suppressor of hairy wing [Clupea harengus]|uniref:Protein suppressor of hairy wing n=1 Tax=Clupea harengus TaxID=7950 RepID=A0A6P3VK19_CLUHA|nr:protein suppressor of hairy wing [Clupea harengus]